MGLLDELAGFAALSAGTVAEREDEGRRVRDLPVVDPHSAAFVEEALAWANARWWRGPGSEKSFRPIQAAALWSMHQAGGLLGPIGTGWGKTLIFMLAAEALGARRPLLMLPPNLRVSFEIARRDLQRSFKIPANLRVLAYSQLSATGSSDKLETLLPDVIVCDEAHALAAKDSARTRRVVRYLKKHPDTRFVILSGTITRKSVEDYAHLSEWALREKSPVPRPSKSWPHVQAWKAILDAKPVKASGDKRWGAPAQASDYALFAPLLPDWHTLSAEADDGELDDETQAVVTPRVAAARAAHQRRLATAPGVITTSAASCGSSLLFRERLLPVPEIVAYHLERLEEDWIRPDGEQLTEAIAKWRCGREITQGFYYRWVWPDGVPDKEWLATRSAWHREVRRVVQRNMPHLDSLANVSRAARRALRGEDSPDAIKEDGILLTALEAWAPHSLKRWGGQPRPPTEAVWFSDYMLRDALAWLEENPNGLVWYDADTVGRKLGELGVPVYGPGKDSESVQGRHAMALSIAAHSDGKNLQRHSANLILSNVPSGKTWEQLVSRTHRAGQDSDEVLVDYYAHTAPAKNGLASARATAQYQQDTTGVRQRMCYGTWLSP